MKRHALKIFIFSFLFLFGCAAVRLNDNQIKAMRNANKIRVEVKKIRYSKKNFGLIGNANVAAEKITTEILKNYCNVSPLTGYAEGHDAILTIEMKGRPIVGIYQRVGIRFSGAIVEGTIKFETSGRKVYDISFKGIVPTTNYYGNDNTYSQPGYAPFEEALSTFSPGSFTERMIEIIGQVYGMETSIKLLCNQENSDFRIYAGRAIKKMTGFETNVIDSCRKFKEWWEKNKEKYPRYR